MTKETSNKRCVTDLPGAADCSDPWSRSIASHGMNHVVNQMKAEWSELSQHLLKNWLDGGAVRPPPPCLGDTGRCERRGSRRSRKTEGRASGSWGSRALEVLAGCDDFPAELAERYGYINRALPPDELLPFVQRLAHRIASFPAHTVAHLKAAVDQGAFGSMAEGLLVEAHESDLSVASEISQARVAEALRVGAETYEGELDLDFLARLSHATKK